MDTKKCIVLLSVLDKLNITEAAKKLGYTPSGVSRIIESMEKELGFPLLIRSHDGVRLQLNALLCCLFLASWHLLIKPWQNLPRTLPG